MPLLTTPVRISQLVFFSFCWAGAATCLCFVAFRLGVRWHFFHRLFWDDALVVFAVCCYIAQAISWSVEPNGLFLTDELVGGRAPLTQHNIDLALRSLKVSLSAFILFLTSIWAIKVSFLLFFKRIVARTSGPKIWWWWFVTVVTLLSYIPTIGTLPFRCLTVSDVYYLAAHCASQTDGNYYMALFYYQMGADIATDLLLVSIPLVFLWNVTLPPKKKMALMGLFSLTLVVMAIAVVRIAVTGTRDNVHQDSAWIAFWAVIEITVAIIVACLGSFRQLFSKSGGSFPTVHEKTRDSIGSSRQSPNLPNPFKPWQRGHQQSPSGRALMSEQPDYFVDQERDIQDHRTGHASGSGSVSNSNISPFETQTPTTRAAMPLKRASQAHVAHHSVAPTERKYMVVHPGLSSASSSESLKYKPGFI